jgi:hypothetical protein
MSDVAVTCGSCGVTASVVECNECGAKIALTNLQTVDAARRSRIDVLARRLSGEKLEALESLLKGLSE